MIFSDSHTHLSLVAGELGEAALRDLIEAYSVASEEAVAAGEGGPLLVDPGVDPGDLAGRRASIEEAGGPMDRMSFLRLAAGIWPSAEALADPDGALRELESSVAAFEASGGRCAAVGECGLDYHHMNGSREAQISLFEGQVELARRWGKPLIVHSREAFEDSRAVLAEAALATGVIIHCFGYGPDQARAFLDLGFFVSFAGNLTYKKSDALREACVLVPADRLLLETDSPYMCPEPRRGKPCTSFDIGRTYAAAAALRGVAPEELSHVVARNASAIFGRAAAASGPEGEAHGDPSADALFGADPEGAAVGLYDVLDDEHA